MTNDTRNGKGCEYGRKALPEFWTRWRPVVGETANRPESSGPFWSGVNDPPAIGEHIVARVGRAEEAMQVVSYFIEHGWIGLECVAQDDRPGTWLVFGVDIVDPVERPADAIPCDRDGDGFAPVEEGGA